MHPIEAIDEAVARLGALLAASDRVVAFTGAGASAPSGVPTYRGAGGSWTRYDPDKYASVDYFRVDPSYYWRFFRDERFPALSGARPNAVHTSLAALEKRGRLAVVVTQNIDGLHHEAGSERVIELHGNTRRFGCEGCGGTLDWRAVRALLDGSIPPRCPACGAASLRPRVVLFGEALDPADLEAAARAMASGDLVLAIGSSLVVYPAAALPREARLHGARLAILNVDPTPLDPLADLVVRCDAAEVLSRVVLVSGHSPRELASRASSA
jgi:NAD-dependent deacetylase